MDVNSTTIHRSAYPEKMIMCLAIPGKVLEIETTGDGVRLGRTSFGGVIKQVCLEYTPEVRCGDYILVHVGFSLSVIDEAEAERTYRMLDEMRQLGELETPEFPAATADEGGAS